MDIQQANVKLEAMIKEKRDELQKIEMFYYLRNISSDETKKIMDFMYFNKRCDVQLNNKGVHLIEELTGNPWFPVYLTVSINEGTIVIKSDSYNKAAKFEFDSADYRSFDEAFMESYDWADRVGYIELCR